MLSTLAGVEPATSWSPVGRRIQLSHRGRPEQYSIIRIQQANNTFEQFDWLKTNLKWQLNFGKNIKETSWNYFL